MPEKVTCVINVCICANSDSYAKRPDELRDILGDIFRFTIILLFCSILLKTRFAKLLVIC